MLVLLTAATAANAHAGASEPRFFGEYAGSHRYDYDVLVPTWPFGIPVRVTRHLTFSLRARVRYRESEDGRGVIAGSGSATSSRGTIPFAFSGIVTGRGRAKGSGTAPNGESATATATLSADGTTLVLQAAGERIEMSKTATGNTPPVVNVTRPLTDTDGTAMAPWGEIVQLTATCRDRQDPDFPSDRLVWRSDRDGRVGTGLTVWTPDLRPGRQRITFTATDSGGLSSSAAVTVLVSNGPPAVPTIESPSPGDAITAGQTIVFRGEAHDPEDGRLGGDALRWSSNINGFLGTGRVCRNSLTRGTHTITLSATDACGLERSCTRSGIRVRIGSADGNTPPTIEIISPDNHFAMGSETTVTFLARVYDAEDRLRYGGAGGRGRRPAKLPVEWTSTPVGASESTVMGSGRRIEAGLSADGGGTTHVVTATVTDSGGLQASDSITVHVTPGIIY